MRELQRTIWGGAVVIAFLGLLLGLGLDAALGAATETAEPKARSVNETIVIAIAVAVIMAASVLSAGFAVARVGAAALGAASEKPELLGRSLAFVGLAEGIALWGVIIAVMLMLRM